MHPNVKNISVEELAKREVKRTMGFQAPIGLSELEAEINKLNLELSSMRDRDENKMQFKRLKLAAARQKYDLIKNGNQSASPAIDPREMWKLQKDAEREILLRADIIACTLSSCYNNTMESVFG